MKFPNQETVVQLRETYKKGLRVVLVKMDDSYSKLQVGDKGTVDHVDDAGGVHINWDCGSTLAAIWGEDEVRLL
jgi:hypothetical protein